MTKYGCELIIDCKASKELCMSDERVSETLIKAARLMGMKIIATSRYKAFHDSPPGIICYVMVDQSFLYCHSFANDGYMSIRVFTCGEADPHKGWEFIKKELAIKDFKLREVELSYDWLQKD